MTAQVDWQSELMKILEAFSCQTGTIHFSDDEKVLHLIAQVGIPDFLIEKISMIPFGKGIAGVAAESRAPVELCNLQENRGDVARPDARLTGVAGSLAVPIFSSQTQRIIGTLGVGMPTPHDFTDEEKERLMKHAVELSPWILSQYVHGG